jgi:hypothetical protein
MTFYDIYDTHLAYLCVYSITYTYNTYINIHAYNTYIYIFYDTYLADLAERAEEGHGPALVKWFKVCVLRLKDQMWVGNYDKKTDKRQIKEDRFG